MPAVLEIVIKGRDQFSGPVGKATVSLGSMVKTGAAAAIGFGGMEAAMMGAKNVIVKSIGAAAAYEHQMAQIRALTGATAEDTDFLKGSIRDMQKTMPKSSAELGAGAYFILSSGITDAADAADVLEIAAKASTVGLGDTAVVADALTTVLNAYQMEAGQAGRVTDVLMQAVKDGKAEADAFSGVLGRVVPIASQMGISFEEVAANMATFTRLGVSAEEAATGLRGVMVQLLKPSEEAKELLASVGMSMEQVREQVREKGLLSVLDMLMKKFAGNEEAISTLFPDVRGLTNVLATAGVQGDAYAEILGNMDTATGNLDRGFEEVSDTTQFKMQKAMNDLNVALQELGAETLPLVASAATTASDAIAVLAAMARVAKGDVSGFDEQTGLSAEGLAKMAEKGLDFLGVLGGPDFQNLVLFKDAIKEIVTGSRDFGGIEEAAIHASDLAISAGETAREITGMQRRAQEMAGALEDELNPALAAAAEEAGKASELFKDFTSGIQDGLSEVMPDVDESFGDWKQRLTDLGQDYSTMEGNLQVIMDALVKQHVRGVDDIMAVVRTQGPEFAADFAQFFRDDPIAAAKTLQQVMPGIMRAAAETAIAKVVAATSKFNEAWQTNVIGALNALPEKTRISIVADVDPELWLAAAAVERIKLSSSELGISSRFWVAPHAGGGTVRSALQLVGERGPELVALPQRSEVFTADQTRAMLAGRSGGPARDEAMLARMIGDAVAKQIAGLSITLDGREVGRVLSPRFAGAASLIGRGG